MNPAKSSSSWPLKSRSASVQSCTPRDRRNPCRERPSSVILTNTARPSLGSFALSTSPCRSKWKTDLVTADGSTRIAAASSPIRHTSRSTNRSRTSYWAHSIASGPLPSQRVANAVVELIRRKSRTAVVRRSICRRSEGATFGSVTQPLSTSSNLGGSDAGFRHQSHPLLFKKASRPYDRVERFEVPIHVVIQAGVHLCEPGCRKGLLKPVIRLRTSFSSERMPQCSAS